MLNLLSGKQLFMHARTAARRVENASSTGRRHIGAEGDCVSEARTNSDRSTSLRLENAHAAASQLYISDVLQVLASQDFPTV